jgi:integrase
MRGHIRQRAARSWTIEASGGFDDGGRRVRISRTVRGSRRDAEKALTALLREVDQGTVAHGGTETFGSYLVDRWLPHMRTRVRPETWDRYENLVRVHVLPRAGKVKLERLRPHHLQHVLNEMIAGGAAPASVQKCHRVMASALKQAMRWQLVAISPAAGVSPPRMERAELRIPDANEMRALVDAAQATPYGLPVLLAATTGARRAEVLNWRWADLDLDAGTASVRRGKTGTARRTIHLPASTAAALRAHRKEQAERRLLLGPAWQDGDLVVDRGDGGPVNPDSLSHAFAEIAERVGLADVRLHDLRHGFATALLRAGVPVKLVSEALGHARSRPRRTCTSTSCPGWGSRWRRRSRRRLPPVLPPLPRPSNRWSRLRAPAGTPPDLPKR